MISFRRPLQTGLFMLAASLAFACSSTVGDNLAEEGDEYGEAASTKTIVVVRGTVITMDESRGAEEVIDNGAVVVQAGKITQILRAGEALPTGKSVKVVGDSDWVIVPGLINLHNHLAYNTAHIYRDLPLYENTYQWRDEKYYSTHIMYPKKALGECSADVAEVGAKVRGTDNRVQFDGLAGRYAEVKELVSGTTATQGSYYGTSVPGGYSQDLVRNLDVSNFGAKRVSQSSLGILVGSFDPRELVAKMDANSIDAWLVHLLEGTDQASRDEFDCMESMGLLRKQTVIIHGTALTETHLKKMANVGAKLVVSPLDNLLYYGQTADLATAWKVGVTVSLGTDWSPAGSKNLLAELKVLDLLNQQAYGKVLTDRDMIKMVTTNPADTIGWTANTGRIKVGLAADLAVYSKRSSGTPYRAVIDATEKDVRFVMVGGDPLYGDVEAMAKLKPTDHEVITGCDFQKAIDVTNTKSSVDHGEMKFESITAALTQALSFDPQWMRTHYAPGASWTEANASTNKSKTFPLGLASRTLDPLFVCQDADFLDEVRTDANVRTSFGGLCLDLRPWYTGASRADCGTMPARPKVLTTAEHDGTLPQRPAAWCAAQNWKGDTLPVYKKR